MYAEELCFAPKYERARLLAQEGAIGQLYMLKQSEKHSGPHSPWFYDVSLSGGGVMMDMGCHALAWFQWVLGKARPVSVMASMQTVLHKEITKGEDNTVVIVEYDNGVLCVAEDSWAKHGGMDDKSEIHGTAGVIYADLFMGNAALTYSKNGYGYAVEKADTTQGWTFTMVEEVFNQGYPYELRHFVECVRENKEPLVSGKQGRDVLELIYAAYASAREGRKISLPFHAIVEKPIDLWLK
jgi:myo-inositol 2-dehydrogenase/D-chiro-inositol 1-dehydrogenase